MGSLKSSSTNNDAFNQLLIIWLVLDWPMEKAMAPYSSILAWKIPWTEEPGGLQFIELQRVENEWSDLAHMQGDIFED